MYVETFGNLATNTDGTELLLIAISFVAVICVVMLREGFEKIK